MAASAVGAGVGSKLSEALDITDSSGDKTPSFKGAGFGEQVLKAGLTGLAAGTATAVMRGGRISATQIAVDAFGTAIGNALGESVAEFTVVPKAEAVRQRTQEGFRAGEIAYQNEYEGNLIAVLIRGVDFSG